MLINCTQKGCLQQTEAKLDRTTNEVTCEACGNVIENITKYTKKALSDIGQVSRSRSSQPFQALCQQCNKNQPLYTEEERAFCKVCNTQVHISAAFMRGLKEYEKGQKKDNKKGKKK